VVLRRPTVSVIVPFAGDAAAARRLGGSLARLELGEGDEVIVADNTPDGIAAAALGRRARVVRATEERSSYHARNRGAAEAGGEWIVFFDADCAPAPDLIKRYFERPVPEDCAILAGAIVGIAEQRALLARYTRARRFYDAELGLGATGEPEGGAAPTGNLAVRRAAFEELGRFAEGIRSAGDFDFCWRAQRAGWRLIRCPDARVSHAHREDLPSFLSMLARYGAGASWINRRYAGASPRWPLLPGLAGSARDIGANAIRGRFDEAIFRSIDAIGLVAYNVGYARGNEAERIR
jgi:GT2 family glycosyltransferase